MSSTRSRLQRRRGTWLPKRRNAWKNKLQRKGCKPCLRQAVMTYGDPASILTKLGHRGRNSRLSPSCVRHAIVYWRIHLFPVARLFCEPSLSRSLETHLLPLRRTQIPIQRRVNMSGWKRRPVAREIVSGATRCSALSSHLTRSSHPCAPHVIHCTPLIIHSM